MVEGAWQIWPLVCGSAGVGVASLWVALWPRCWPKRGRSWPGPDRLSLVLGAVLLSPVLFTGPSAWLWVVFSGSVLTAFGLDARRGLLPDGPVVLCAIGATLCLLLGYLPHGPLSAGLGAALGWALLWSVGQGFQRVRGHVGLGSGDAGLFAALGLWVGVVWLPLVLMTAATAALAVALVQRRDKVSFGPFMILASWIALLFELLDLPKLIG